MPNSSISSPMQIPSTSGTATKISSSNPTLFNIQSAPITGAAHSDHPINSQLPDANSSSAAASPTIFIDGDAGAIELDSKPQVSSRSALQLLYPPEPRLSDGTRMLAATVGSLLTCLAVTPFDVVKTRMQSQSQPQSQPQPQISGNGSIGSGMRNSAICDSAKLSHYRLHTGLVDIWCQKCDSIKGPAEPVLHPHQHHPAPLRFTSSIDAFVKLVRFEGISSLWRGLGPTLVHSLPATVLYFWGYDNLKMYLTAKARNGHERAEQIMKYSPIIAGVVARSLSTIVVSPVELIKTKSQSYSRSVSAISIARQELKKGGPLSLWRGVSATLWRDVPFSAIYWMSYETLKRKIVRSDAFAPFAGSDGALLWASFISGASGGMAAALVTHPFDIVKTRRQIEMFNFNTQIQSANANSNSLLPVRSPSTSSVFSQIIRDEGWRGFTSGLAPRVTKIGPACAIMISTYEIAKAKFGKLENSHHQVI